MNFRTAVKRWVESKDSARNDLAREFQVAPSTVDRWWRGTATPHSLLQKQVVEWIKLHDGTCEMD